MRFSILWMLPLLTVVNALAGTHVNISISQQHSKNAAQLTESNSMGDQVQLKSDAVEQIRSSGQYVGDQSGRSARIEVNDKDDRQVKHTNHRAEGSNVNSNVMLDGGSERVHLVQPHYRHRSMYNSNPIEYQRNGQFRQMNNQQKQNMEFERYIQHYHSGPTVETVYESADGAPSHSGSSRVNEGSQGQRSANIVKFERQVALPAAPVTSSESDRQVQQHQPVQVSEKSSAAPVATSSSSVSASSLPSSKAPAPGTVSVSTPSGNSFQININQRPASVGSDGLNFDQSTSYLKPSYNDPTPNFKYNDDDSDIHFQNQYPPSVEEPQGGYGGYFQPSYVGNAYDPHYGGHNYLPPEASNQRPLVTKTIQIAQPAIKTKKYEVRHPAIQKEFYDIEERVLIKPAGTVVVELERPVAKIPKGESILPLGHPHPAVAGAYMNNGKNPSFSNIIYSASGGSHQSQPNNQFSPSPDYNAKHVPGSGSTIASSITSNPRFDQGSKELAVEANLNKQYNGESHYTATAAPVTVEDSKPKSREVIVVTDGQGHQRQVSPDQFSYSRDETDKGPSRSVYNLRSYSNHNNVAPQRSNYQPNQSNRNDYAYEAEYISNPGNTNIQRDNKPARLEEAPVRMTERQQLPIIKHEHNIHLAPSQHKIYLTRKDDVPQSRYVEESAHVQEVKPYLRNQRGPVIVYAATAKPRSEMPFRQAGEYRPQSQVVQYRNPDRSFHKSVDSNRPEISAPYAQIRYHPEEQKLRGYTSNERDSKKYGQLILEDNLANEMKSKPANEMKSRNGSMAEAQTSIEISIPDSSQDSHKPIMVSSTIRPMMTDDGHRMHNSKLEISITNNGEPKENQMEMEKEKQKQTENEKEQLAEAKEVADCDKKITMGSHQENEQKFMRIVEAPSDSNAKESASAVESAVSNIQANNVDVHNKGSSGHQMVQDSHGSRVIAATPAPKDPSSASESFHKRRIVVNHPFQTVREVVEHEPYTNYHEVQVNEPASPALYHSAAYYQSHGSLRDGREGHHMNSPVYYQ